MYSCNTCDTLVQCVQENIEDIARSIVAPTGNSWERYIEPEGARLPVNIHVTIRVETRLELLLCPSEGPKQLVASNPKRKYSFSLACSNRWYFYLGLTTEIGLPPAYIALCKTTPAAISRAG